MTHRRAALVGAVLVLALPLTGALPAQAAPQAHDNADTRADDATVPEPPADEDVPEPDDVADTADDAAMNATGDDTDEDETDATGPDADVPEQAPAFVSDIHELVRSFLGGELDGPLGHHVSAVTPGGGR